MTDLEAKLDKLPNSPGVYIFKDDRQEVIYVGKAKSLRGRVRSYFRRSGDTRSFYELLTSRIADFDFVVTGSEKEALILENNLIKQFRPRYNIRLRDEKTYISLKINLAEPYPRIQFPKNAASRAEVEKRKRERDVLYFGPYSSAKSARETVRFVNNVFPIRKCTNTVFGTRTRPCLNAQMGNCMGPCSGKVDEAAYREMLNDAVLFLRGKNDEALAALRAKMNAAAGAREYERAAKFRDQIAAIKRTVEKQKISGDRNINRDVFGLFREGGRIAFQAMFVRRGRLEDVATHEFDAHDLTEAELLAEFIQRFYGQMRFIPPEVLVSVEPEGRETLEEWLAELRGAKVTIAVPQRGARRELIEMACRNARSSFEARHTSRRRAKALLESLQKMLGLSRPPERIECFDISNMHGRNAVGSLVAFTAAAPDKARYRRFKIKTVEGSDDFAMMREVLGRRYRSKEELPDLILVDGGAGQVSAATDVTRKLGIDGIDLVGIAKPKGSKKVDRFFKPGQAEPIVLPRDSGELLLLERIRDEAHRFAITYHKKLRERKFLQSPLEDIPGLGPKRIAALKQHFGTLKAIESATPEQLAEAEGISTRLAKIVYNHLHTD
jgi:excinuclease ABC subunit C